MRLVKFFSFALALLATAAVADEIPTADPSIDFGESGAPVKIDVTCRSHDCLRFGWDAFDHGSGITAKFTCVGNDCRTKGWNYRASIDSSKSTCKAGGCFVTGWTERQTFGLYTNDVTCKKKDCWKYGWDLIGTNGSMHVTCDSNDCSRYGGTTVLPSGVTARMRCTSGDCLHVGYTISQ